MTRETPSGPSAGQDVVRPPSSATTSTSTDNSSFSSLLTASSMVSRNLTAPPSMPQQPASDSFLLFRDRCDLLILVSAVLLYGFYGVLNVPARVPLGPLVELLRPPFGLLEGRETGDLPLFEEHHRNHLVTGLFQRNSCLDRRSFCLLLSAFTIPLGKGTLMRRGAKMLQPEQLGGTSGIAR